MAVQNSIDITLTWIYIWSISPRLLTERRPVLEIGLDDMGRRLPKPINIHNQNNGNSYSHNILTFY